MTTFSLAVVWELWLLQHSTAKVFDGPWGGLSALNILAVLFLGLAPQAGMGRAVGASAFATATADEGHGVGSGGWLGWWHPSGVQGGLAC